MMPMPGGAVTVVTGTVKECRVPGCVKPAKTHDALCRQHELRRIVYTLLQLAGLIGFSVAGFMHSIFLGVCVTSVSLVLIGLALER